MKLFLDDLSDRPSNLDLHHGTPTRLRYELSEGESGYWSDISAGKIHGANDKYLCAFEPRVARQLSPSLPRSVS